MAYFSSRNPNKTFSTQLAIGISLIFGVFFQSLLNFFSFEIYGSSIPITLMILIYWNIALPKNIVCKLSYFLFNKVENGFKIIIEKSPTKKKHTKIGERIFHNEIPEALEIT